MTSSRLRPRAQTGRNIADVHEDGEEAAKEVEGWGQRGESRLGPQFPSLVAEDARSGKKQCRPHLDAFQETDGDDQVPDTGPEPRAN